MSNFYFSREWRELRYRVLRSSNKSCQCCLAKNKPLHVDHIKPISKFPELKLDINNLQVLCEDCNLGKSNLYFDDFRDDSVTKRRKNKDKRIKHRGRFSGQAGYLKVKPSAKFHIWDGFDTKCKMYSTKHLRIRKVSIMLKSIESDDMVCLNCLNS